MNALRSRIVAVVARSSARSHARRPAARRVGLMKRVRRRTCGPPRAAVGTRCSPCRTSRSTRTSAARTGRCCSGAAATTRRGSMNEHSVHPVRLGPGHRLQRRDPAADSAPTAPRVNLFCAGHAYLPDGRLLVAGGHLTDGDGIDYAGTYDHRTNTWTPLPAMNGGRWYPTATTLADGRVLVISGSAAAHGTIAVERRSRRSPTARAWRADRRLRRASRSTRACTSPRTGGSSWRAPTP